MHHSSQGRPNSEEYHQYYDQYIRLVGDGDILEILERQIVQTGAVVAAYSAEQARWRPALGEWCATEIVGHLADVERVYAYRALRVARADLMPGESFDPDAYMASARFEERPLAGVMAEFAAVRAATLTLLRGLATAAWEHRAPEPWTIRSVLAFAYFLAGHELHHGLDLRRYGASAEGAA
jgi:hypothetical protein